MVTKAMKCSDCQRYCTALCRANPKGEDHNLAERFECFVPLNLAGTDRDANAVASGQPQGAVHQGLNEGPSRKTEVKGQLKYFGLVDWWFSTFSDEERDYFERSQSCIGVGVSSGRDGPLARGDILSTSVSSVWVLAGMIGALRGKPEYLHLVQPILQEGERRRDGSAIDLDLLYALIARVTYPLRDRHPDALKMAIEACKKMISVAPQAADMLKKEISAEEAQRTLGARLPAHEGYTRLLIIYEKEGRYGEVIELARQAKSQEWNGDWDKRITRCEKKLGKQ
jgi:hypothetical protein